MFCGLWLILYCACDLWGCVRSVEKFDNDFMFQLTVDEFKNLMSKNSTSSWGGRRKLPYAFTEQGIYMLMTVQNLDYYADRVFEFELVSCDV